MQSVTSNAVSEALSLLPTETKTGGKWREDNKDIYIRTFSYSGITLGNSSTLVDSDFPITKSKIISLDGMFISSGTWSSIPSLLYVLQSGSQYVLRSAQGISSGSASGTLNVIVRYVK